MTSLRPALGVAHVPDLAIAQCMEYNRFEIPMSPDLCILQCTSKGIRCTLMYPVFRLHFALQVLGSLLPTQLAWFQVSYPCLVQ